MNIETYITPPRTGIELWEQYLESFISKCPEIEEVINFTVTEKGIDFEVKDFTKFDIPEEFYSLNLLSDAKFYGLVKDGHSDDTGGNGFLIQNIYSEVARHCNESGEYTIDAFNGRYTCRKVSEIEQIHYEAMSDKEKAKYDAEKKKNALNVEIQQNKEYLNSTDYIVSKLNELSVEGTAEELATAKEQYAEQLQKRKEARAKINELEKELATLESV